VEVKSSDLLSVSTWAVKGVGIGSDRPEGHRPLAGWRSWVNSILEWMLDAALGPQIDRRVAARPHELAAEGNRIQSLHVDELKTTIQRYEFAPRRSNVTVFAQDRDLCYTSISNSLAGHAAQNVIGRTDQDILPDAGEMLSPLSSNVRWPLEIRKMARSTSVIRAAKPNGSIFMSNHCGMRPKISLGSSAPQSISRKVRKVLLVEDEALVAMIAVDSLIELGCEVVEASTARAALEHAAHDLAQFEFAVIDLGLPDRPGEELKEQPEIKKQGIPLACRPGSQTMVWWTRCGLSICPIPNSSMCRVELVASF